MLPMKLWKFLTQKTVLKQLLFVLVLFILLIPMAMLDSASQVKVRFSQETFQVRSDKYNMTIQYSDIASAELTDLAEAGEKVADAFDDKIIRTGVWHNEAWGEYIIVVDLDTTNCVKLTLEDGRVLVFSRKNNTATEDDFLKLQSHL